MHTTPRLRFLAAGAAAVLATALLAAAAPAHAAPASVWTASDPLDQPANALAGDMTRVRVSHTSTVTVTMTAGTTLPWSGATRSWQKPRLEFAAGFDTDLDGRVDHVMRAGPFGAPVANLDGDVLCTAERVRIQGQSSYRFAFPASCIGSPASFTVSPSLYHEPAGSYLAGWTLDLLSPHLSPVISRG